MSRRNRGRRPQAVVRAAETGAKVPQDRAQKAEALGAVREVTYKGITWVIDPADLNDYRIIEAGSAGNPVPMMRAIIPDDTIRMRVLETLADEKGRIPLEALDEAVHEIMRAVGLGK